MGRMYIKHGYAAWTHPHKLYRVWSSMKQRCLNKKDPSYKNYGARGINVCEEWIKSAKTFIEWALNNGYQEGLTIERINNNLGYSPANCRFATQIEQLNNRRKPKRPLNRRKQSNLPIGVRKWGERFSARIGLNKKEVWLGMFSTVEEASQAYQNAVKTIDAGA